MPILNPKKDESEKEYVARCIPDLMNKDPERDQKQAVAICYSNFKKATVKEKMGSFKESIESVDKRLTEGKQVGSIYHHTSYSNALSIITSNKLIVGKTGYISFTRNKLWRGSFNNISGVGVFFKIDGNKLSNNYKITPYSYHNIDVVINDEAEERIFKKNINNITKYIDEIFIYKNLFPHVSNRKEIGLLYRITKIDEITFNEYIEFFKKITDKPIVII